jgi:hypothetical protein
MAALIRRPVSCQLENDTLEESTNNAASRSASVIASLADGGTEKPSASFSGCDGVSIVPYEFT